MNTKLTLRLDDDLIRSAKRYSSRSGKSLSRLVADYFTLIACVEHPASDLTPRVRSLYGSLAAGHPIDEQAYRRHLERKHR